MTIVTKVYAKKRKISVMEFKFNTVQDIIDFSKLPLWDKLNVVKEGISKDQLEDIRRIIEASYAMLYSITGIQSHSFTSKKGQQLFSSRLSEPIVQMLNIYGWGYEFFGDCGVFNKLMYYGCLHGNLGQLKNLGTTFLGREYFIPHLVDLNNENENLMAWVRGLAPIPAERYKPLS